MIINLMLGKGRGGLEQAALDYAEALRLAGIDALTVTHPEAWANAPLAEQALPVGHLFNYGGWDPFAAWRLKHMAHRHGARAVICHGNRALSIALRALSGRIPVIAVAHNYQTRRFGRADACFAITHNAANALIAGGIAPARIHHMPNAVRIFPAPARAPFRAPPIIGSMGRFVHKKGFGFFIEALGILKSRGVAFRAILGGDGSEREKLDALIRQHHLHDDVALPGWVTDKDVFFRDLDIFVLPSLHEPFGIVLLEAMVYGVPTVSADAEGPREILHDGEDGLLVPRGTAEPLADALERMLKDEAAAQAMGRAARALVEKEYSLEAMAARLKAALRAIA